MTVFSYRLVLISSFQLDQEDDEARRGLVVCPSLGSADAVFLLSVIFLSSEPSPVGGV